eukprot:6197485-Pleurochrysis_carterae.AAC.5
MARTAKLVTFFHVHGKLAAVRSKPPDAPGSCLGASHITSFFGAGTCSSSISPAGRGNLLALGGNAAVCKPVKPNVPQPSTHADADADADASADADANTDVDANADADSPPGATSANSPSGRFIATFELESIALPRQKSDVQRNAINNLKTEIVNFDKKAIRAQATEARSVPTRGLQHRR